MSSSLHNGACDPDAPVFFASSCAPQLTADPSPA